MKNGEIILCKGIKMDKNYDNTLSYSESSMVTLCRQHQIATSTKYHILDPIRGEMEVSLPYSSCIYANYIAFINRGVGNKWYFAFVDSVEYINPATTKINYKVDVFSTWYSKFNIGQAFIEREHVDDDTFGLHTVPEGLDTGEFIINTAGEVSAKMRAGYIVIGINKIMAQIPADSFGKTYGNVPSGLVYIIVPNAGQLGAFLRAYDNLGQGTAIQTIFTIPVGFYTPPNNTWPTFTITGTGYGDVTIQGVILTSTTVPYEFETGLEITMNSDLNGYTPVNQKTYTSEFNYLLLSNNAGQDVKYNYEDFIDPPKFNIDAVLCPGCSIKMYPVDYKKYNDIRNTAQSGQQETHRPHLQPVEFSYGITAGKYPIGSWSNDAYTNWLTQQAVNEKYNDARQVLGYANKDYMEVADISGGVVMPLVDNIMNKMQARKMYEFAPNQTSGNVNAGDVAYSSQGLTFMYSKMSVRYEYARKIDNFFSRFGYRVNEIKTPNLASRTKFNYIKVGGSDELIHGDIPASDLEEINAIFRKGTTIFHDYSTFGNYTQTNTIITPTP